MPGLNSIHCCGHDDARSNGSHDRSHNDHANGNEADERFINKRCRWGWWQYDERRQRCHYGQPWWHDYWLEQRSRACGLTQRW
jgi:hypothetical protein